MEQNKKKKENKQTRRQRKNDNLKKIDEIESNLIKEIEEIFNKNQINHYFTSETEKAIILYNSEKNEIKKNIIYQKYIHYPLSKIVENIIHTFKFYKNNVSYEDTKNDVLSFLVLNLSKFDPNVSKAFSFFSVICKNYLISKQKNYVKEFKNHNLYETKLYEDDNEENVEVLSLESLQEELKDKIDESIYDIILDKLDFDYSVLFKEKKYRKIAEIIKETIREFQNQNLDLSHFNKRLFINKLYETLQSKKININQTNLVYVFNKICKFINK